MPDTGRDLIAERVLSLLQEALGQEYVAGRLIGALMPHERAFRALTRAECGIECDISLTAIHMLVTALCVRWEQAHGASPCPSKAPATP